MPKTEELDLPESLPEKSVKRLRSPRKYGDSRKRHTRRKVPSTSMISALPLSTSGGGPITHRALLESASFSKNHRFNANTKYFFKNLTSNLSSTSCVSKDISDIGPSLHSIVHPVFVFGQSGSGKTGNRKYNLNYNLFFFFFIITNLNFFFFFLFFLH